MRAELSFAPLARIETELLAVVAADTQTAKGPDAKPQPVSADRGRSGEGRRRRRAGQRRIQGRHQRDGADPCACGPEGETAADRRAGQSRRRPPCMACAMPPEPPSALPSRAASGNWFLPCPRAKTLGARGRCPGGRRGRVRRRFRSRHLSQRPQGPERAVVHAGRPGVPSRGRSEAAFAEGAIVGESQNFTRSLVNEPGNVLTPTEFGRARRGDGERSRAAVRGVLDREAARIEDGRVLERGAGIGGAARADRDALRARRRERRPGARPGRAKGSRSIPAASPSSPPTTWRR